MKKTGWSQAPQPFPSPEWCHGSSMSFFALGAGLRELGSELRPGAQRRSKGFQNIRRKEEIHMISSSLHIKSSTNSNKKQLKFKMNNNMECFGNNRFIICFSLLFVCLSDLCNGFHVCRLPCARRLGRWVGELCALALAWRSALRLAAVAPLPAAAIDPCAVRRQRAPKIS